MPLSLASSQRTYLSQGVSPSPSALPFPSQTFPQLTTSPCFWCRCASIPRFQSKHSVCLVQGVSCSPQRPRPSSPPLWPAPTHHQPLFLVQVRFYPPLPVEVLLSADALVHQLVCQPQDRKPAHKRERVQKCGHMWEVWNIHQLEHQLVCQPQDCMHM